jgi:signal transduction histidine kinase
MTNQEIGAETLFEKLPVIAVSGGDTAVDSILMEVMKVLTAHVHADIGQITLLPKGGMGEKLYVLKDCQPWLKKGVNLKPLEPNKGFTGRVLKTGESVLIRDIWAEDDRQGGNPFLEIVGSMDYHYIQDIKKPVSSIIILPIKRGNEIFCTIELSRYRNKAPFSIDDKRRIEKFSRRYGPLIMDYVIDVRDRITVNTAHDKLLKMARLIASNAPIDHREAVEPYTRHSTADVVMALFKTGSLYESSYRMVVAWKDDVREVLLANFIPSTGSSLRDGFDSIFPVEGEGGDRRMADFADRIEKMTGLSSKDRELIKTCLDSIKSYVIYPLHMLGQELGVVILSSRHPSFWKYLHMNPFLATYNSLLKSFLLNERLINFLSDISLKIHNPGFYCLGAIKGIIVKRAPEMLTDPQMINALNGMEELFTELHDQGRVLRWRYKTIDVIKWIRVFIDRKEPQFPGITIDYHLENGPLEKGRKIKASDEQLETIFENLFTNSIRAINTRIEKGATIIGKIDIIIRGKNGTIDVEFKDNGMEYETVSGRGSIQIKEEMERLRGRIEITRQPYRTRLTFPSVSKQERS